MGDEKRDNGGWKMVKNSPMKLMETNALATFLLLV